MTNRTSHVAPKIAEAKYTDFVETALTLVISGGLLALAIGATVAF